METTDDIYRLTAALRTVCAELDDASSTQPAAPSDTPAPGTVPASDDARHREAVREAVRALDDLMGGPR